MQLRTCVVFVCSLATIASLSACSKPQPPPLPAGEQTISGLIKPAEISLKRRGTHVLIQNGQTIAFLESKTVNLKDFEERTVDVVGTYEPNTDVTDLPVLVVTAVKGGSGDTRSYTIPSLGVSIDVPREWKGTVRGSEAQFTAQGSGAMLPLLSIFYETPSSSSSSVASAARSSVTPTIETRAMTVDGRRAEVFKNAVTRTERVVVEMRPFGSDLPMPSIVFLFTPSQEEEIDQAAWDAMVQDILRSVKITGSSSSASSNASEGVPGGAATSDGVPIAGTPCGGEAGVLCPTGMYCKITDFQANIGVCAPL